jgi:CcmD family protein
MNHFRSIVVVLLMVLTASMAAQQIPPPVDEFVPMSELADRELLPATPLVFYAYGFVWLALLGYVFSIWRRMAKVEQDLADVQRRLQEGRGGR